MEEICSGLPFIDSDVLCVGWFKQALDHCLYKMTRTKYNTNLWYFLQDYLLTIASNDLTDPNILNLHPPYLSLRQCERLVKGINNEYLLNASPRQNIMTSQARYCFSAIVSLLAILCFFITLRILVNGYALCKIVCRTLSSKFLAITKLGKKKHEVMNMKDKEAKAIKRPFVDYERCLQAMKFETKYIRLKYDIQAQDIFHDSKMPTLILRCKTRLEFSDLIVSGETETLGRFNSLTGAIEEEKKTRKEETKSTTSITTPVARVLQYINQFNTSALHIVVVFDDLLEVVKLANQCKKTPDKSIPKYRFGNTLANVKPAVSTRALASLKTFGQPKKPTNAQNISAVPRKSGPSITKASPIPTKTMKTSSVNSPEHIKSNTKTTAGKATGHPTPTKIIQASSVNSPEHKSNTTPTAVKVKENSTPSKIIQASSVNSPEYIKSNTKTTAVKVKENPTPKIMQASSVFSTDPYKSPHPTFNTAQNRSSSSSKVIGESAVDSQNLNKSKTFPRITKKGNSISNLALELKPNPMTRNLPKLQVVSQIDLDESVDSLDSRNKVLQTFRSRKTSLNRLKTPTLRHRNKFSSTGVVSWPKFTEHSKSETSPTDKTVTANLHPRPSSNLKKSF